MKDLLMPFLKTWGLPILVLLVVNFIYFSPVVFNNKVITQDDIKLGKAKGKEIVDYRESHKEEPLWTNAMFSGMPTFQITTSYANNVFKYFQKAISKVGGSSSSIYIIFSLMLGMFLLLKSYQVDTWLSVIGAIAFGFSAFFIIGFAAGHNAKVRTAAYSAPLIMGVLLTYRGKLLQGFALTAFFMGMSINSNHFQVTYYTAFIVVIIGLVYGIKALREKSIGSFAKSSGLLIVAFVVGIGPNIGNLWSTYAYTQETMRGGASKLNQDEVDAPKEGLAWDYAMSWSHKKAETFALIIPNFTGGGAKQNYEGEEMYDFIKRAAGKSTADQATGSILYWGESSGNGAYYVGALVFFFFVLGLFLMKVETRTWVLATLILSLFLAWGKHFEGFNRLLFEYLPMYNKFRVPSMALIMVFVIVPFGAMLGLHHFTKGGIDKAELKKKLLYSFYIAGGLTLVVALLGPSLFDMSGARDDSFAQQGIDTNLILDNRASLMRNSAFRSFMFIAAGFGLLWFYLQDKLKTNVLIPIVGVLIVVDLWSFDKDQLGKEEFESPRNYQSAFSKSQADNIILKDTDIHYRVMNTTVGLTGDSYTSYYHKSIGGYHGAKLSRYQDLIDNQLNKQNQACYNMLNAKWYIINQNKQITAAPNPNALGNAWFVNSVKWVKSDDEEMASLNGFDPSAQAIINEEFKNERFLNSYNNTGSTISLSSYDPKHMVYESNASTDQLAVFSEIYYVVKNQEWQAFIDGKPVSHFRANYLLRGLNVPSGKHTIEFKFLPKTFYTGEKVDLAFSIILMLALVSSGFITYKNSEKQEE